MMIQKENIIIGKTFKNKKAAIQFIGQEMLNRELITSEYISSMIERDKKASVAIGNFLAIPHGQYEDGKYIRKNGIVIVRLDKDMIWDDNPIKWIIGLALDGDNQIDMLQNIAIAFMDENKVENMYETCKDIDSIFTYFNNIDI